MKTRHDSPRKSVIPRDLSRSVGKLGILSRLYPVLILLALLTLLAATSVSACQDGDPYTPPGAGVWADPSFVVCCGVTVHLHAYQPFDDDKTSGGAIVADWDPEDLWYYGFSFRWESVGQLTVQGPNADYTWNIPGKKLVRLCVIDPGLVVPDGGHYQDVEVTVVGVASVTPPPHGLCPDENGTFHAVTYPPDNGFWVNWEGGGGPQGEWLVKNWPTPGTKTVTATCGCSSASATVEVFEPVHEVSFLGGQIGTGGDIVQ